LWALRWTSAGSLDDFAHAKIDRCGHASRRVLGVLADRGLLKGQRIAIDATTLEANAAMRSIVERDRGESYEEFLRGLAKASEIATPTREDLAGLDRKRKKRTSNKVGRVRGRGCADCEDERWAHPSAAPGRARGGSGHGCVLAVTLQGADKGDMTTLVETLGEAGMAVAEQVGREAELRPDEGERGRHRRFGDRQGLSQRRGGEAIKAYGLRSYIPATLPSAGTRKHSEAAVGACGSVQLEPDRAGTPRELKNRAGEVFWRLLRFLLCLMTTVSPGRRLAAAVGQPRVYQLSVAACLVTAREISVFCHRLLREFPPEIAIRLGACAD
jgi:hypothetical protein